MNYKLKIFSAIFILLFGFIFFASNGSAQNEEKNAFVKPIPPKARELLKSGRKLAIEQDKISEGLARIKEAINVAPNFVTAHSEYIRIKSYWLDKQAEAQAEYEALIKKQPDNPVYPLALAQGLTFSSRANKEAWFTKAAALAPDWAWGHFAKARAADFAPVVNFDLGLAELLKAVEKDSAETQFYEAVIPKLVKAGKLDEAARLIEKLPADAEPSAKMNLRWDLQLARESNSAEATEKLKTELAKLLETSRDIDTLKAVRLRYRRLKNEDKIKEAEAKIVALDPSWYPEQGEIMFTIIFEQDLKRIYFAGRQNQINNKFQDVDNEADALEQIQKIEALLKLNPNTANKKFLHGRLLVLSVEAQDTARAVRYGELLLTVDPNWASTLARLAQVYSGQTKKNLPKALEYSGRAMELTKEFRPAQRPADMEERTFNQVMPESRQKEYYQELRSIVLNSRAFVLAETGKTQEAETLLRESIALRPGEEAYLQVEKILRKLGRNEEADKAAAEGANFWRNKIKAGFKSEPLKDFELTTIKGEKVKLSALKGKVVMLNYWATWCEPCIKEMPLLVELYDKYRSQGLEILAISVDVPEDRPKIPSFVEKTRMNFPVLYDENSAQAYGVSSYPTLIFVDREGNARYRLKGLDAHHAKRNLEFIILELMKNES
jgi:thiol-disulfide isomerase/thioredoxin